MHRCREDINNVSFLAIIIIDSGVMKHHSKDKHRALPYSLTYSNDVYFLYCAYSNQLHQTQLISYSVSCSVVIVLVHVTLIVGRIDYCSANYVGLPIWGGI